MKELIQIQTELNAPKNRHNNFGKYKYRNLEDIFEAVKPHLAKHGCTLNVTDDLIDMGGQLVIKATATIQKGDSIVSSTAFAGIDTNRKGMDIAQSYGASGSYARKYAVSALFLLDDSKDVDTPQSIAKTAKPKKTFDESNENWDAAIQSLESGQYKIEDFKANYQIPAGALKKLEEAAKKATDG